MRLERWSALLVCGLIVHAAPGQVVFYDNYRDYPATISLGSLDAEISKGKLEAARTRRPELEFEIVKLSIKDIVDRNRADRAQQVSFASPERFRKWLVDTSRKIDRPYDELVEEIVAVVAPNPVPDLTGDSDRFLRERALRNVEGRSGEYAPEPASGARRSRPSSGAPRLVTAEVTDAETDTEFEDIDSTGTQATRPAGNPALIKIEYSDQATTRSAKKK